MARFVTGDLHFYHDNIIRYACRPFASTADMNRTLRDNWNACVADSDTVYVLGDFAMFRWDKEHDVEMTFRDLRGRKRLLRGNHDKQYVLDLPWEAVADEEVVDDVTLLHDGGKYEGIGNQPVFCSHVHEVWKMRANLLNVGVDVWHFQPVEFGKAVAYWEYRYAYWKAHGRDA